MKVQIKESVEFPGKVYFITNSVTNDYYIVAGVAPWHLGAFIMSINSSTDNTCSFDEIVESIALGAPKSRHDCGEASEFRYAEMARITASERSRGDMYTLPRVPSKPF